MDLNTDWGDSSLNQVLSDSKATQAKLLSSGKSSNETPAFDAFKSPYFKIMSGVGFTTGVIYAFYKKTGFWKGWGIAIIGAVALGGIGTGFDYLSHKNKQS